MALELKLVELSRHRALLRAAGIACLVLIVFLSLIPGNWQVRTGAPGPLEHFVAYLITALVIQVAFRPRPVALVAALAILGGSMEILQHFSPGRDPQIIGFLASALGGAAGTYIAFAVCRRWIGISAAAPNPAKPVAGA